jgi:hypothetical protein
VLRNLQTVSPRIRVNKGNKRGSGVERPTPFVCKLAPSAARLGSVAVVV